MQRLLSALLVLALLANTALAEDWQETKSYEGNFKIQMPGEPKYSSSPVEGSENVSIHTFAASLKNGEPTYMLIYNDYPQSLFATKTADKILDDICQVVISSVTEPKATKSVIRLWDFPGRNLEIDAKNGDDNVYSAWRVFLVNKRLYQVGIVRIGKPINDEDKKKYFGSFALLQK